MTTSAAMAANATALRTKITNTAHSLGVAASSLAGVLIADRTTFAAVWVDHAALNAIDRPYRRLAPVAPRAVALSYVLSDPEMHSSPGTFDVTTTIAAIPIADASRVLGELVALPETESGVGPPLPRAFMALLGATYLPNPNGRGDGISYDFSRISGGPTIDAPTAASLQAQLVADGVMRALVLTTSTITIEVVP